MSFWWIVKKDSAANGTLQDENGLQNKKKHGRRFKTHKVINQYASLFLEDDKPYI